MFQVGLEANIFTWDSYVHFKRSISIMWWYFGIGSYKSVRKLAFIRMKCSNLSLSLSLSDTKVHLPNDKPSKLLSKD